MKHRARDDWLQTNETLTNLYLLRGSFFVYNSFTRGAMDLQPLGGLSVPLGAPVCGRSPTFSRTRFTGSVA